MISSRSSWVEPVYNNLSGGLNAQGHVVPETLGEFHRVHWPALPAQNSFAASNRTAQHSRYGVSVSTPGSLPGNPLNDPENPRYGSAVEAEVVPELDSARVWWRCGNGAAKTPSVPGGLKRSDEMLQNQKDLGIKRCGRTNYLKDRITKYESKQNRDGWTVHGGISCPDDQRLQNPQPQNPSEKGSARRHCYRAFG